jgi:adenylate cyclase
VARLILHPGKPDERVIELVPGMQTIGRTAQSDICVPHPSLSRLHARLSTAGPAVVIEDLQSRNGTFVDGVRIERRELGRAHYIKCGDVLFSFVGEQPSPSSVPPPTPTTIFEIGRELDTSAERLKVLLRVSEVLSSPAPLDAVLGRVLELAFEILDVDRGAVVLTGPAGQLEARAARGAGWSKHIVRYVIDRGVAAIFADPRGDPRLADSGSIVRQSIAASMCAPLCPRDRPAIGALYVDNVTRHRSFGAADLELLVSFANQAAIAVDHAMLSKRLAEEAQLKNDLLRFFPPTAIDAVLRRGGRVEPYETEATVLFCDISGFTELSAELEPRELLELLNAYLPVVADIVFRHEGTLEKYIGDAVLAVWGAPLAHPDDVERAVRAAVDMQHAVAELGRSRGRPLAVHIGINTGRVAAGNIGTNRYLQFATIGEATNLASRICGVAGAGEILVDERSAARLAGFPLEGLPPVSVKGKGEPLRLCRVLWRSLTSSGS